MNRSVSTGLAGALCAAATMLGVAAAPSTAHAYEVNGLAVGADASLAGPSGLAVSFGLGRLELDFITGLSITVPEGGDAIPGFSAAGGVFFTVADGESTNFQVGGRIGTIIVTQPAFDPMTGDRYLASWAAFTVDVMARIEHRFDDHFAMNFQVGIGMQAWPDDDDPGGQDFVFGFGNSGFVGGAGFRYWFDGLGGGTVAEPEPAAAPPARRARPAAEPAQEQPAQEGGEQPYWE